MSWRLLVTATCISASLAMAVLSPEKPKPLLDRRGIHAHPRLGYRIEAPPQWTRVQADNDGSILAPANQPEDGFFSIVVSTRFTRDADPMAIIDAASVRPDAGPVKDVRWTERQRTTIGASIPAALAEFEQTYLGVRVRGWMLVGIRDNRLYQAVGVVPASSALDVGMEVLNALRTLEPD